MYAELGRVDEARDLLDQLAADERRRPLRRRMADVHGARSPDLSPPRRPRPQDAARAAFEPYQEGSVPVAEGPNFLGSVARYLGLLCMTLHRSAASRTASGGGRRSPRPRSTRWGSSRSPDSISAGCSSPAAGPATGCRARRLLEVATTADALGMAGARGESLAMIAELDRPPCPPALAGDRPAFVGRDAEVGQLRQVWHKVAGAPARSSWSPASPASERPGWRRGGPAPPSTRGRWCSSGAATRKPVCRYQPFVEALSWWVLRPCRRGSWRRRLGPAICSASAASPCRSATDVPRVIAPSSRLDPETERWRLFEAVASHALRLDRPPSARSCCARRPALGRPADAPAPAAPLRAAWRPCRCSCSAPTATPTSSARHPLADDPGRAPPRGGYRAGVAAGPVGRRGDVAAGDDRRPRPGPAGRRAMAAPCGPRPRATRFFVREILRHLAETGVIYQTRRAVGAKSARSTTSASPRACGR